MNSGYRPIIKGKKVANPTKQPKTSTEENPGSGSIVGLTESEKRRAEMSKVLTSKWLVEKVPEWAEDY